MVVDVRILADTDKELEAKLASFDRVAKRIFIILAEEGLEGCTSIGIGDPDIELFDDADGEDSD